MATLLEQVEVGAGQPSGVVGRNPWALAARRLRRNRIALAALALFLLIVVLCLAAPLYAKYVAHVNPFPPNLNGHTVVNGKVVPVMQQGGGTLHLGETPIGPTWDLGHYFLGADGVGRDVAALLLYGGRSSLLVGIGSAILCCIAATVVALIAGFFGGTVDALLSRLMDIIWAFPVYLLAISLSTELLTHSNGFQFGPVHVSASSLWLPTVIIAVIYVPYVYRPIRGQVLSVVNKEFVEASIAQGAGNLRLIFSEILPNVVSTVIVLLPLMVATTILTESALSFLSRRRPAAERQLGNDHPGRHGPAVHPAVGLDRPRDHDPAHGALAERVRRRGPGRARPAGQAAAGGLSGAVLTFIIRRLLWTVLVMFVITVVVFVIFFKTPGVDPARAIAGRNPSAQVLQEIRAQFGLDKPLPVQYADDDEEHLRHQGPGLLLEPGREGGPRDRRGHPRDAVAGLRRRADLGGDGDRGRGGRCPAQGHGLRPAADGGGADRDLRAGFLAGRGRQPDHAGHPARYVPVQLGAAAGV